MTTQPTPMLTRAELANRGWTRAMVAELLDPADERRPNPFYRSSTPMYLYRLDRVEAAETGAEFSRLARRARLRSARAKAVAARRRECLLAEVEAATIELPDLAPSDLARAAVTDRNERESDRCYLVPDRHYEPATVTTADPRTLARWQVNYLRHRQRGYDALLGHICGRVGSAEATRAARVKLYRTIAESYPHLRAECERRLRMRAPEEVPMS